MLRALVSLFALAASASPQQLLGDLRPGLAGSNPNGFARLGKLVLFAADDGVHGLELCVYDGSTVTVLDLNPGPAGSAPGRFVEWRGRAWFSAHTAATGSEVWSTDGTAGGTGLAFELAPGPDNSTPFTMLPLGDRLLITTLGHPAGDELWVSDGTPTNTRVIDIDPTSSAGIGALFQLGDQVYFVARDSQNGTALWATDGTLAGTRLVADPLPGPRSGFVRIDAVAHGRLWLAASASEPTLLPLSDIEPWVSDGTAHGTVRVLDLTPGPNSSLPRNTTPLGNRVVFLANAGDLYVSDGTASGTTLVAPGLINQFAVASDRVFFAKDGEPWVSDGTPSGTFQLLQIWPGPGSQPRDFTAVGNSRLVLFTANAVNVGRELWRSDGTSAGTQLLGDRRPGIEGFLQGPLTRVGTSIYCSGNDGSSGAEPFRLTLAELGAALVETLGGACPGSAGEPQVTFTGAPALGQTLSLELAQILPNQVTALVLGAELLPGADRLSCVGAIAPPHVVLFAPSDANGRAALPLAVPNATNLLGAELFGHWLAVDPQGQLFGALASAPVIDLLIGR